MSQHIASISLLVQDYDDAIAFFVGKLGFILVEDTVMSETKRWVVIKPPGDSTTSLLLAKAANEEQKSRVGNQTGGRVFLFLHTDNFDRDYHNMLDHKIEILRQPQREEYGTVAVFKDLYGNLWDMIEPAKPNDKL